MRLSNVLGGSLNPRMSTLARVISISVVVAVVAAGTVAMWPGEDRIEIAANFGTTVGVHPGSDVRVLGIPVGTITSVEPSGRSVRVEMEVEEQYEVPADAKAAVVAPSVVSDRYVQLAPVYKSGPVMEDGATIPMQRTVTPVELDEMFRSLNNLNVALGPKGANKHGALSRLLDVGAANLDGQGEQLNQTLEDLSRAVQTLSSGRQDLFGTVRNLQVFTTALAQSDDQVRAFNTDLASVADQLSGERDELAAALRNLAVALDEVSGFVRKNKHLVASNVAGLAEVTGVLVKQKKALEETLDVAPLALGNLNLAYNPGSGTLDTRDNIRQLDDPALYLCSLIRATNAPKQACDDIDGLFAQLHKLQQQGQLPGDMAGLVPTSGPASNGSAGPTPGTDAGSAAEPGLPASLSTSAGLGGLLADER